MSQARTGCRSVRVKRLVVDVAKPSAAGVLSRRLTLNTIMVMKISASRPVVVLGPVEPVVRAGLLPVLSERFDVVEVVAPVAKLHRLGAGHHVVAVVMRRADAASADPSELHVPCIGVSTRAPDVLAVSRDDVVHLANPSPEALADYIATRHSHYVG